MSDEKLPIHMTRGPLRPREPGSAVLSDVSVDQSESLDFRSSGFGADALTLARATGRSLPDCRQELFIAEGDMGLAYGWLVNGYVPESVIHAWH